MKPRIINHLCLPLAFALLLTAQPLAFAQQATPQNKTSVASTTVALPRGVERVASVEGITEYRLPNGLKVLLFPDQTKQTITVNMTYLVGSRHENYGETGMAHLFEHLLFKGSKNHPNTVQEFAERGARYNGTTSFDRTNYFESFAATDANLDWALRLEADRMVNSFIAKKDLDSEMTVVRNEFEAGENSPFGLLYKRVIATAFDWHNYGNVVIGSRADIENVPIERLQAFYRNYYQPDNAVLLVAGKFDEAKTLQLVNDIYSPIPRPTRTLQKFYTVEPAQDGERNVTVRRVGDTQFLAAAYHVPPGSHPDAAPLALLSSVLAGSPSSRLHKALVETQKAASVFGFSFQLYDPGLMFFGSEVRKEKSLDEARAALLTTIEETAAKPPTAEEVERARTALLTNIDLTLNSADRVGLALSEWMAMGDWRLFFLQRDRIRKATPADLTRVANAYLKNTNRTVGMFIPTPKPDRAEIPGAPDVAALVRDYKGDASVAAGETFDPSPENLDARTTRQNLPGGLQIALLPKKTRGNTVVATMTLRFGSEKDLMNRSTAAAQLTGAMLQRGTAKRTRQQISDEFDRLKARVFIFGGVTQAGVSIETVRENLPAVMRLVAEILREPSFPATEFAQLKQEQLAGIEQGKSEPGIVAATALSRHMSPYPKGDPRYTQTFDEELADVRAVTLEDVKKFYTDFYGASNAQLAVVGDFDDKAIANLANELFGNWRSPRPFARLVFTFKDVPAINQSIETPDKANAVFQARLNLPLRDDDPDYPALVLANYILGGSGLNSRLAARIRGKEGLSYGVGSGLSAGALDKSGSFSSFAIYAPQNAAKLEAAYREEIARALREGFTAEEIAAAKVGYLQSRQVSRAQDAEVARSLVSQLYLNRTYAYSKDLERRIAALTPEQLLAAMRRNIDPAKITIIKAGDFAGAATKTGGATTTTTPKPD